MVALTLLSSLILSLPPECLGHRFIYRPFLSKLALKKRNTTISFMASGNNLGRHLCGVFTTTRYESPQLSVCSAFSSSIRLLVSFTAVVKLPYEHSCYFRLFLLLFYLFPFPPLIRQLFPRKYLVPPCLDLSAQSVYVPLCGYALSCSQLFDALVGLTRAFAKALLTF